MHNGQLGDWTMIRRQVEFADSRRLLSQPRRHHGFGSGLPCDHGRGGEEDMVGALARTVQTLTDIIRHSASDQPFRFTIALADGETLYGLRYAWPREAAHTLYYQDDGRNVVIASEPLDAERSVWRPAPVNSLLIARKDSPIEVQPFLEERAMAAE